MESVPCSVPALCSWWMGISLSLFRENQAIAEHLHVLRQKTLKLYCAHSKTAEWARPREEIHSGLFHDTTGSCGMIRETLSVCVCLWSLSEDPFKMYPILHFGGIYFSLEVWYLLEAVIILLYIGTFFSKLLVACLLCLLFRVRAAILDCALPRMHHSVDSTQSPPTPNNLNHISHFLVFLCPIGIPLG